MPRRIPLFRPLFARRSRTSFSRFTLGQHGASRAATFDRKITFRRGPGKRIDTPRLWTRGGWLISFLFARGEKQREFFPAYRSGRSRQHLDTCALISRRRNLLIALGRSFGNTRVSRRPAVFQRGAFQPTSFLTRSTLSRLSPGRETPSVTFLVIAFAFRISLPDPPGDCVRSAFGETSGRARRSERKKRKKNDRGKYLSSGVRWPVSTAIRERAPSGGIKSRPSGVARCRLCRLLNHSAD